MKKVSILLILAAILLISAALPAFASGESEGVADIQLAGTEIHDDDPHDDPAAGNHDDPIPHDDPTQDEMDGEGGSDPLIHDGFYHRIGDAEFYTEHDLDDYIYLNPRGTYYCIDIERMLRDVWGTDGGLFQPADGYMYTDSEGFSKYIHYEYINDEYSNSAIIVGRFIDMEYRSKVICRDEPEPSEGYILFESDLEYGLSRDMCALLLYIIEQNETNPRSNIAGELGGLPSYYVCGH